MAAILERADLSPQEAMLPLVSLLIPAYNEAAIIEENLLEISVYMEALADRFRYEIVVIDDGSLDGTGPILDRMAGQHPEIKAFHHHTNFGLGQALKFGFSHCAGDYIVTLDCDLSYAPEHIGLLLDKIVASHARIVVASPYMPGGRISHVPWLRKVTSVGANRLLAVASNAHLSTLTGMVRAYDGDFLRSLNFRSMGMEVNADIIRQAQILRARVVEIPAHLDWERQTAAAGGRRRSGMRIGPYMLTLSILTFLFRPVMFFALIAFIANMLALVCAIDIALLMHESGAGSAFSRAPHLYFLGAIAFLAGMQMLGFAAMALHAKRNFEDVINLGTATFRRTKGL